MGSAAVPVQKSITRLKRKEQFSTRTSLSFVMLAIIHAIMGTQSNGTKTKTKTRTKNANVKTSVCAKLATNKTSFEMIM